MFKTAATKAATKIAHNSTIPALAGNSDLRQFQDLINAEKVVLVSIQKLGVDMTKSADLLRAWGAGEGDDLGDVLSASATLLVNFAVALSAYAGTHHGMRDTMKAVRTREEALDDLRRRRRRVCASADGAAKKLNRMSPEHKNLTAQSEALNRMREEMRAMDGEIVREEAELSDYKRRCVKTWMQVKFGGLVECCEKGAIVGDIGKAIVAEIPEDVTQPGLPRAYYGAHPRVSALVSEAQRTISQIAFTPTPSAHVGQGEYEITSSTQTSPQMQNSLSSSPYLPAPRVGSGLNIGGWGSESLSSSKQYQHTASADELGVSTLTSTHANNFISVPARGSSLGVLLHDGAPVSAHPMHDASGSFTNSITDALASHAHNISNPNLPLVDDPAPKYEPPAPSSSRYTGLGDTSLPPGAAPAAIRAWSGGLDEKHALSESSDRATNDASASGDEQTMSMNGRSNKRLSRESEGGLPYDREEEPEDTEESEIALRRVVRPGQFGFEEGEVAAEANSSWKTEIQRRISRVPPPPVNTKVQIPSEHARVVSPFSLQPTSSPQTPAMEDADDVDDDHARNVAAAREVSREMDALAFSTPAPVMYSNHPTQLRSPPQSSYMSGQTYAFQSHKHPLPPVPQIHAPQAQDMPNQISQPPSPLAPPSAPFAQRFMSQINVDAGESRPLPNPVASRSSSPAPGSPIEYPRPQPPFSSPLMTTSSLSSGIPGVGPRMISAAAFRRPVRNESQSSTLSPFSPADASPLLTPLSVSPRSSTSRKAGTKRRLSVVNPDPVHRYEDDSDYRSAYPG